MKDEEGYNQQRKVFLRSGLPRKAVYMLGNRVNGEYRLQNAISNTSLPTVTVMKSPTVQLSFPKQNDEPKVEEEIQSVTSSSRTGNEKEV